MATQSPAMMAVILLISGSNQVFGIPEHRAVEHGAAAPWPHAPIPVGSSHSLKGAL